MIDLTQCLQHLAEGLTHHQWKDYISSTNSDQQAELTEDLQL